MNGTYEKCHCSRCGAMTMCLLMDNMAFCNACFDIMSNDIETKSQMVKIMVRAGLLNIEH